MNVDQESAVIQFLNLARNWQSRCLNAVEILPEFVAFYRDVRIEGAPVEADGDMLLLQWGAGRHALISEPTDMRKSDDVETRFAEEKSQYLDFTRQVFVGSTEGESDDEDDEEPEDEDDEPDFDDAAIQMSMTLVFGPAVGDEKSGNLWIEEPQRIDQSLKKHEAMPLVRELMHDKPVRYVATVFHCG